MLDTVVPVLTVRVAVPLETVVGTVAEAARALLAPTAIA
jgi:hypothetical protein